MRCWWVFFLLFLFSFFIKFYIIFFILLCFYILVTIKFNVSNSNTIMNLMSSIISNRALFQKPISKCECLTLQSGNLTWWFFNGVAKLLGFFVFNVTLNNISVISWRSALLVESIVPWGNHRLGEYHWNTLSQERCTECMS